MAWANNVDTRIFYEVTGEGEPVMFGHGFTLDHRMWRSQVSELSKKYQCITVDFRGHGKSEAPETGYSRDHRITDYLAVADELGLETFHIVGLSMGAMTAIGLALDHPTRLKSLVIVSGATTRPNPDKAQDELTRIAQTKGVEVTKKRWLDSIMKYYEQKPEHQRDLVYSMISEHSGAPWLDPNRGTYNNRDDLALLVERNDLPPTLIMVGELDLKFHKIGRKMHEAIEGSKLEFVPNVGHLLNIEQPTSFNQRLSRWLETLQ